MKTNFRSFAACILWHRHKGKIHNSCIRQIRKASSGKGGAMKTLTSSNKIWASECKSLSIIHRIALTRLYDYILCTRGLGRADSVVDFPGSVVNPSKAGPLVKLMKFQFGWRDNVSGASDLTGSLKPENSTKFSRTRHANEIHKFLGPRDSCLLSIFPGQCWTTSAAGPVIFSLPLDELATTGEFMMKWVVSIIPLTSPFSINPNRIFLVS